MAIGALLPPPWFTGFDDNGDPLSGGLLYTYEAGTTTPLATYSDSALTVPNANPVVLDSAGRATIYLLPQAYKVVLKTSGSVTVRTQDNILDLGSLIQAGGIPAYLTANLPTPAATTTTGYLARLRDGMRGLVLDDGVDWRAVSQVFDVTHFGALGDGTTNDAAAIRSAMEAARDAGGGTVYFPPGTYRMVMSDIATSGSFNGGAWIYANTIVRGAGWGTHIKSEGTGYCLVGANGVNVAYTATNVIVRDLKIQGDTVAASHPERGVAALSALVTMPNSCSRWIIENVYALESRAYNIYIAGSDAWVTRCLCESSGAQAGILVNVPLASSAIARVTVHGNICRANYLEGIDVESSTAGATMRDIAILGNLCLDNYNGSTAGQGIVLTHPTAYSLADVQVIGNTCRGNGVGIYLVDGLRRVTVAGNVCDGNVDYGIRCYASVSASREITIAGNVCSGQTAASAVGLEVRGDGALFWRDLAIVGNVCKNNGTAAANGKGIHLTGNVTDAIVADNICGDDLGTPVQGYGVVLNGAAVDRTRIRGNLFQGNITAGLLDSGSTGTRIAHNLGYVSENGGSAAIGAADTSKVVSHGLATTPGQIIVTASWNGAFYVDTLTTTQFTAHFTAPGGGGGTLYWRAALTGAIS